MQRLPCSEVLQRRSSDERFEKNRRGRESVHGAAQGYLRSTQEVARGFEDVVAPDSCTSDLLAFLQR